MNPTLTDVAGRIGTRLGLRRRRGRSANRRVQIARILERPGPPRPSESEGLFEELQGRYPPRPGYGWDPLNNWQRAVHHAPCLLKISGLTRPGARVLEAACGDGMTGVLLASFGHDVTLHDLEDWRDERARPLPLITGDLCRPLPIEPGGFDLIYSYNAFEHIHDPSAALAELIRLCRPGGVIYLDFGPLYASPWGLHATSALRMPYPQYLFTEAFLERKFEELGLFDLGRVATTLQPLNRWSPSRFERLWRASGLEIISATSKPNLDHLGVIERCPDAFAGLGLTFDDVTVEQMDVALRKPAPATR